MNLIRPISLVLLCFAFVPSVVWGQLNFIVIGDEAKLTGCEMDATGVIEIPAQYRGYPVTEISSWAFQGRDNVTGVVMPDTITKMGRSVFRSCDKLEFVSFSQNVKAIPMMTFESTKGLREIIIPNSVKSIETDAFNGCTNLKTVKFGENLLYLGPRSFLNCEALENVDFNNVTRIGSNAFYMCQKLTKANLESVQSISDRVFSDCTSLSSLIFGPELMSIGYQAFYNCSNLVDLKFNNSKTFAFSGYGAFQNCSKISSLDLNVKVIPQSTFENCKGLVEVLLRSTVKKIEDKAFANCVNLKQVIFMGDAPVLVNRPFSGFSYDDLEALVYSGKKGFSQPFGGMFVRYITPLKIMALDGSTSPFSLTFESQSDSTYKIEASHDLKKWGEIGEAQGTGSSVEFTDWREALFQKQYYRLKLVE